MSSILVVASAAAVFCSSPSVHDGDGLLCGREKIRIANIDAPERRGSPKCEDPRKRGYAWCDFAAGEAARRALIGFLAGKRVTIVRTGTDVYGRTLALVYADGVDVGEWLIRQGHARRWR